MMRVLHGALAPFPVRQRLTLKGRGLMWGEKAD